MMEHPEESLWIHADDRGDIFRLQDVFGLHPLAVQAIVHTHQPSKVEEYDSYLFTIIDGVKYERQKRSGDKEGEEEEGQDEDGSNNGSPSDHVYYDNDLEEDDLYVFLEQRWIITINFNSQQLQSNIKEKISKSSMPSHRSISIPLSEQQQQSLSNQRNVDRQL